MAELWEKYRNHALNEGLSDNRLRKLKTMFIMASRGIAVPLGNAKREHIEEFLNKLNNNKFLKINGKNYSGNSKVDVKKFLKQFYKWLNGNNEFYPPEVSWVKCRIRKDEMPEEKPVISIKEVEKLSTGFINTEYRMLTLILFDSGFRISEILSAKKKDLTFENYDDGQKCWWIKCNASKTIIRKVDIPIFTEELNNFVNSAYYNSLQDGDLLFNCTHSAYRVALRRKSLEILKKRITPHSLRHSSATYYATAYDGDMIILANRYGWSYSAKELKTYVRRSGAMQKRGARKLYSNEIQELKKENKQLWKMVHLQGKVTKSIEDEYKKFYYEVKDKLKLVN